MKISHKILMIALVAISFNASADEGRYYVGLGFDKSNGYIPKNSNDDSILTGKYSGASVASIVIGRQFNNNISFDLDLSSRGKFSNDKKDRTINNHPIQEDISIKSLSAMMNGYYHYYNENVAFKPYITAGVGVSDNKKDNHIVTGKIGNESYSQTIQKASTKSVAWKVGTGIKYILDKNFEIDLRYQFVNLGNVRAGNSETNYYNGEYTSSQVIHESKKLKTHEFLINIIYKF